VVGTGPCCVRARLRTRVCAGAFARAAGDGVTRHPPMPQPIWGRWQCRRGEAKAALARGGSGGSTRGSAVQSQGVGMGPPQPAPPTPVPVATNPLSGVPLFSLEGKQRGPVSAPARGSPGTPGPPAQPCASLLGVTPAMELTPGVAVATTVPTPLVTTPGAHSPWGLVARPMHGALRGAGRTGRRRHAGVGEGLPLSTHSPGTPYSPCSPPVAPVAPWDPACPGSPSLRSGRGSPACPAARARPSRPASTRRAGR